MFNVGDEIAVVDDAPFGPDAFELSKGDRFVVLAVYPKGTDLGNGWSTNFDAISIGREWKELGRYIRVVGFGISSTDVWPASRFRKIEKKRTREELYSLIGINGMVEQRESVTAFHKIPCESASLRASARQPVREMAVGVTVGSPRRVSRGTNGARLAVTLTRKGTRAVIGRAGRPAAAAQRIGTAEGSGDGSSVRSEKREGVAA